MAQQGTTDWKRIKTLYCVGEVLPDGTLYYPTHKELAARFGCAAITVSKRSADEKWRAQRTLVKETVTNRPELVRAENHARTLGQLDEFCTDISLEGLSQLNDILSTTRQALDTKKLTLSIVEHERLAKAAETYQRLGRLSLGESTSNVAVNWAGLLTEVTSREGAQDG